VIAHARLRNFRRRRNSAKTTAITGARRLRTGAPAVSRRSTASGSGLSILRTASGVERHRRIEPVKDSLTFHFDRWRKLATDPVFAEEG